MREEMNMINFDQIIDANMTVTDHLLRDAIHAVIVDAIHEAVEHEREACAKVCERKSLVKGGEVFAARIRERGATETGV